MKTYRHKKTNTYLTQLAYDRWLSGRDPQDIPQNLVWTAEYDEAAVIHDDETHPLVLLSCLLHFEGCEIVDFV